MTFKGNWDELVEHWIEKAEADKSSDFALRCGPVGRMWIDIPTFSYTASAEDRKQFTVDAPGFTKATYKLEDEDIFLFSNAERFLQLTGLYTKDSAKTGYIAYDTMNSRFKNLEKLTVYHFDFDEKEREGIRVYSRKRFDENGELSSHESNIVYTSDRFDGVPYDSDDVPLTGKLRIQDSLKDLFDFSDRLEKYARKNDLLVRMSLDNGYDPFMAVCLPPVLLDLDRCLKGQAKRYANHVAKIHQMILDYEKKVFKDE
ncbi:MAG: hypothetical protein NDI94_00950 [Candidatus Woesearchaeota archaeon]|nr:hypothetical protein [Candidatus Woesearchaeota archaeon]